VVEYFIHEIPHCTRRRFEPAGSGDARSDPDGGPLYRPAGHRVPGSDRSPGNTNRDSNGPSDLYGGSSRKPSSAFSGAAFPRAASRASGATSAETNISSPSPANSEGSAPPAAPNAPLCGWNSSGSG
jgi:hypothetical protein